MLLQQVGQALEERQFDELGECNSVMISVAAAGWTKTERKTHRFATNLAKEIMFFSIGIRNFSKFK